MFLFLRLKKSSLNRLVTILFPRPNTGRSNLNARFAWPLGKKQRAKSAVCEWEVTETHTLVELEAEKWARGGVGLELSEAWLQRPILPAWCPQVKM